MDGGRHTIVVFSTLGSGSNEESRIRELLRAFSPQVFPFERRRKWYMWLSLLRRIWRERPALVVMEGTGIAGGAALIACRLLCGTRYVVSSGDAVGPWIGGRCAVCGPFFAVYERLLCRLSAGFVGWTPYLAGRALTFGTPRAMTAAGWAPFPPPACREDIRRAVRKRLGIPQDHIVIGIAGSLAWSSRYNYCYGMELVSAAAYIDRPDITFLIIGDGSGADRLAERASHRRGASVVLTGRIPQCVLPEYYAAMDVGSLPQSADKVGSFRFTTKLSEYVACGLPIITGPIPLSYDLDGGWIWRVNISSPWSDEYARALATLVERMTAAELAGKREAVPVTLGEFSLARQQTRAEVFINDLLDRRASRQ